MQILQEQNPFINKTKNMNVNISIRDVSSHNFEVKEKQSSDASLRLMHPVASGDNVATDLNASQKFKEELPTLVPCCEGKELQINQDLVRSGLSAISMKHENVIHCLSMSQTSERTQMHPPGLVKHRNSFRSLHRPDLKRVPYLRRMTPDELEMLFRGYADLPTNGSAITGNSTLCTVSDVRPTTDEIPVGMRLHGARARLYTSVLAGAKAGDQPDNTSNAEEYDTTVPEIAVPEDEVQLNEELQIILPPRCDDTVESTTTTSSENNAN
ncbi:unnamed protein product [Parnassius mnemosyne]|uniref:Uncharacterized protein n=1 Tax=Parnassius mnemosyne TaxID=213953 RepID=A0AAV1M3R4_9NEOP